jgi:hypothetical protein
LFRLTFRIRSGQCTANYLDKGKDCRKTKAFVSGIF